MRLLQAPASKGYAETNGSIVTSIHPTDATVGATFGNNNEQQQFRTHITNSNLECSTTTNNTITTAVVTIPLSHQQQQQQQHQQQSHNNRTTTNTTTGTTLEKFNCDDSLSDSTVGTALREHQNNIIIETSAVEAVDSLRNVDSSNNSFFDDCVNGFVNLENYRTTAHNSRDIANESQSTNITTSNQRDDTESQKSGQSTPSFEEIHLDNFALERELNRIIRGTSISEACEDDNSCNCKSLQESLKSYELIRRNSGGSLIRNDRNASPDGDDDADYDDDQMVPRYHAESINRSSSFSRRNGGEDEDDDDDEEDSLMDDDDEEYLSSQASSCTSVSTPQRSHFPRGIINPNYPGFQHLAHTLSEHYISHQSSDPYDSDLSEYEMELSVDSFECDFLDVGSGNSNTNHNNNNNLNTIMVINNNSADSQLSNSVNNPGSDDEESNFNTKPPSGTTGSGGGGGVTTTTLPLINVTQTVSDTNLNTDDEESNNLQTYLKLYDVTTQQQENERNKSLEIEIPQDEGNFGCPTPDILIKNYNNERYSRRPKPENRPDLLRNVSPNPPMKCRFEALFQEDEDKLRQDSPEHNSPPDTLCTETRSDAGRDDISLGLTPVDIVGDFGEEVEREFGLIVSGYNSRLEYVNYPTGAFYLYNVGERIQPEKMSDALLSNGTEQIATSKYTTVVGHLEPLTHQPHHRMPSETDASTLDIKPSTQNTDGDDEMQASESTAAADLDRLTLTQEEDDDQLAENNLKTRSSTVVSASLEPPDSVGHSNHRRDEHSPEKYIPTAIVKPKYQKSSYDERQLPPIGLDFNVKSRAWFDCPSTSGSNVVRSVKKSQNTERNSKIFKSAKLSRGSAANNINNNNNNSHSAAVSRFGTATRRSGSSNKSKENCMVAVVPPMMKDSEELQHGEEHLDNKPVEPHCTRYSIAAWAASLRDSKRAHARQCDEAAAAITDTAACFDVYNIETALPEIDLEAIESHLKRANEEERRRRNDREEIRRRLAMGAEDDYFSKLVTNNARPGRKPSLQSRLQNGKNLQICFMNEASSDTESHSSDSETCPKLSRMVTRNRNEIPKFFSSLDVPEHPYNANPLSVKCSNNNARKPTRQPDGTAPQTSDDKECDFFTKQARLQIEARMALSQAKDMAHMQMELDRQKQRLSPITGVIRGSLEKVGVVMAPEKRRVSRQMLTDMNIAQLQIIVNDLHTQIEDLNDSLVHYLMERDDLHMGQDSMLVDIEDISRFLSAKELEEDQ